jgi:hypothetical protein
MLKRGGKEENESQGQSLSQDWQVHLDMLDVMWQGAPNRSSYAGFTLCPEAWEDVESPWSPGWAGASASLLPGTSLGIFPPAHPGWQCAGMRRGGLEEGGVCAGLLSQHPEEGQECRSAPSFQEQRSAASLDQSPKCSLPWQLQHQTGPPCGCGCKTKSPGAETNEVAPSGPHWKPGNLLLKCTRSPKNVMMALLSRAAFPSLAWKHRSH